MFSGNAHAHFVTIKEFISVNLLSVSLSLSMEPATALSPGTHYTYSDPSFCWSIVCGGGNPFSCETYDINTRLSSSNNDHYAIAAPFHSTLSLSQCMYSASSPSSSTDITDISDIFPSTHSPSSSDHLPTAAAVHLPPPSLSSTNNDVLLNTPLHSPPYSERKQNGGGGGKTSGRVKRNQYTSLSSSNKPYQRPRTGSPVFPDGAVPLSALTAINSNGPTYNNSSTSVFKATSPLSRKTSSPLLPLQQSMSSSSSQYCHSSPLIMKLDSPQYVEQFEDIERKLLKLHSDKARLIQTVQDKLGVTTEHHNNSNSCNSSHAAAKSSGKIHLSVLPTGQTEFDNGFIEEVNSLLLTIGGLYSTFESSLDKVISLCSSAQPSIANISDCFPYILSLLAPKSYLQLQEDPSTKLIQVECKSLLASNTQSAACSDLSPSLRIMLEALNEAIKLAQSIQQQGPSIHEALSFHLDRIRSHRECLDNNSQGMICSNEVRSNIRHVLTGNHTILTSVVRIWRERCQVATDTLTNISECLTIHKK